MPVEDITLPSLDVRALARRAAVPAAAAGRAASRRCSSSPAARCTPSADALRRALDADPRWVLGGVVFELLSFAGYIALLWMVGSRATPRLDLRESTQVTLGGAGGDAAAADGWRRRRRADAVGAAPHRPRHARGHAHAAGLPRRALRGLPRRDRRLRRAASRSGSPAATGRSRSPRCRRAAATLAIVAALAAGRRRPRTPSRAATGRLHAAADVLGGARARRASGTSARPTRACSARSPGGRSTPRSCTAMLNAFGAPPPFAVVVLAYFVGQVANTIPIPGAVSGGIVGVLLAFGVAADLALVSVLAYRAIAIWLPAPIGLVAARRAAPRRWPAGAPRTPRPRSRPTPRRRAAAPVARAPRPRPACAARRIAPAHVAGAPAATARAPLGCWRSPARRRALRARDGRRRRAARPRGRAHRPLRHARPLDLRARRGARVPRDRRLRRARSRRARRRSCSAAWSPPRAASTCRVMLAIAWMAAALGDLASFALGRSASGAASSSPTARASASPRRAWSASRTFFDRHGGKAILIGRFIGLVRAVAPFLAGASGMRLRDLPAVEPARHRRVGDDLHARRLRLPRIPSAPPPTRHPRRRSALAVVAALALRMAGASFATIPGVTTPARARDG